MTYRKRLIAALIAALFVIWPGLHADDGNVKARQLAKFQAEASELASLWIEYALGDPDFVELSIEGYTSTALAKEMAAKISLKKAADVKRIKPEDVGRYESRETTHFSVMDRAGNAVSQTYTLGSSFGSGYVATSTGILMDNQMRNFSYRDSALISILWKRNH